MKKQKPIIQYRDGTEQADNLIGKLNVHSFQNTIGAERILVPEHSIFLAESDAVITHVWKGMTEKQREWELDDIGFLPAGTEIKSSYVSAAYSTTMIRIKDSILRGVARGDIDYDAIDLRFQRLPRSHVFGICASMRNLSASQMQHDGFAMLVESMTNSLAITVLLALSADRPCAMGHIPGGLSKIRKKRALDYIEDNLSQPITLADIASAAALSPYHFTRAFSAEMGVTPMRYVWARRTELAKRLMLDRHMTLSDVAHACGFSSQSHFTTAFRQSAGVTPGMWRRDRN